MHRHFWLVFPIITTSLLHDGHAVCELRWFLRYLGWMLRLPVAANGQLPLSEQVVCNGTIKFCISSSACNWGQLQPCKPAAAP